MVLVLASSGLRFLSVQEPGPEIAHESWVRGQRHKSCPTYCFAAVESYEARHARLPLKVLLLTRFEEGRNV